MITPATTDDGGGISNGGTLLLTNSTVTGNKTGNATDDKGGGTGNFNGVVRLTNTILAGNTTSGVGPDCIGLTISSQGNSIIGNDKDCDFSKQLGDQVGTAASPINPKLGPLQDNGGPTFTPRPAGHQPGHRRRERSRSSGEGPAGRQATQGNASDIGAFEVGNINARPVASNQSVGTTSNSTVAIKLIVSDADAGDVLCFTLTSLPASGDLSQGGATITTAPKTLTGDTVTYVPRAGSSGLDSFKFKANDGTVDSNIATVIVIVIARANAVPLVFDATVGTSKDTSVSIKLGAADAEGDTLSFIITSLPASGDLFQGGAKITAAPKTLTGDTVSYTPDAGFGGTDSFKFNVNDGTVDSSIATVTINVVAPCGIPAGAVKVGWTLIGWTCEQDGDAAEIATKLGGTVKIYEWDATSSDWKIFSSTVPVFFNTLQKLTRWNGYWINYQP